MYRKKRRNVYQHKIDTKPISLHNCPKDEFRQKLEELPYLMYKVEDLPDGREIVINKPGGKRSFGRIGRRDYMVWVHDVEKHYLWLISHKDILEDLKEKSEESTTETLKLIELLERTYDGGEPNGFKADINKIKLTVGESPELILKVYKWIWGQEDCNYPPPKMGRAMSMEGIIQLKKDLSGSIT